MLERSSICRKAALVVAVSVFFAGCGATQSTHIAASQSVIPALNSAPATVPFFKKTFTYAGKTYTLKIVGTDPVLGSTTVVGDQIVPIALQFKKTVLDGTNEVATVLASPIFASATYPSGTTQFSDGLMRAEFWTYASGSNYHVLLAPPTVEPTVTLVVPPGEGSVVGGEGRVSFQWFIKTVEPLVLLQLQLDPKTLTIFLTDKTRVLEPTGFCCYGGYHTSFELTGPTGPAIYTTAWSSARSGSVVGMAHEVTEWMNDPFYSDSVPKWASPTSAKCVGTKFEVGDPLAGEIYRVNGYQVSDMTFYSWFAQDVPSIGINGQYDMLGDLQGPATVCT